MEKSYNKAKVISFILIAISLIILEVVGIYYLIVVRESENKQPKRNLSAVKTAQVKEQTKFSPKAEKNVEAEEEISSHKVIKDLQEAERFVKENGKLISSHSFMSKLLKQDFILHKLVASVANVANGETPASTLYFLAPKQRFSVKKTGGKTYIDPASYKRYDEIVDFFVSIDEEKFANIFNTIRPAINFIYSQLGYPEKDFYKVLKKAADNILKTPILEKEPELVKGVINYKFKDYNLESLSPIQKQLLRMGPENIRRIKSKVLSLLAVITVEKNGD